MVGTTCFLLATDELECPGQVMFRLWLIPLKVFKSKMNVAAKWCCFEKNKQTKTNKKKNNLLIIYGKVQAHLCSIYWGTSCSLLKILITSL